MTNRIAFLDRDGVINQDLGYVSAPADWTWVNGAISAIRSLNQAGYKVVVVTNQSGIGRGYYSEQQFHDLMRWVGAQLSEHHAHIDAVYFCPHHPEHGLKDYRIRCECRKPAPGMLLQALHDLNATPADCVLIGDRHGDLDAARGAGVRGLLFDGSQRLDDFVSEHILQPMSAGVAEQ